MIGPESDDRNFPRPFRYPDSGKALKRLLTEFLRMSHPYNPITAAATGMLNDEPPHEGVKSRPGFSGAGWQLEHARRPRLSQPLQKSFTGADLVVEECGRRSEGSKHFR